MGKADRLCSGVRPGLFCPPTTAPRSARGTSRGKSVSHAYEGGQSRRMRFRSTGACRACPVKLKRTLGMVSNKSRLQ